MKKLFSLLIVALISTQMWAAINVTINGTPGYSGVSSLTGLYYSSNNSVTSSTYSVSYTGNSTLSKYSYSSNTTANKVYKITINTTSGNSVTAWSCTYTSVASASAVASATKNVYYADGNTIYFKTTSSASVSLTATVSGSGGGGGSGSGSGSTETKNYTANGQSCTMNAYDLGTNDNILWGDRALGATSTTGVGLYYQYGSTTASTGSALSSYSYSGIYTASNSLPADKDAATAALGEGWRMPTSTEYTTLISKTTISRTSSSANYATAVGNTNTIYFYYGGYKYTTSTSYASSSGNAYFWTSTKYSASEAYRLNFSHTTSSPYVGTKSASGSNHTYFYYAQQVKPVYDSQNYTLTVKADGSTSSSYSGKWGASTTSITASKSGYNFVRWSDGNTSNPRTFKICNATYTAEFEAAKVTATFKNYDNTTLYTNNNVTPGTTPSYGGSTPTRPSTQTESTVTTYTFTGWSPALGNITTNTTYTAQFSSSTNPRTYTIRFLMDDGETVLSSDQVAYGANPIEPVEPTKISTAEYSYNFTGWDPAVTTVSSDQDYVAVFQQVALAPKYTLTIGSFDNGSVTLTANGITQTVPAAGGAYQYEEGTTIIVEAVPTKGFHFTQWSDLTTAKRRQIAEIDENKTLTPAFEANTLFTLDDEWDEADCLSNYNMDDVLTVALKSGAQDRTFTAGQWATLSVPFNCTLDQEDELYNAVYRFSTMTLSVGGGSVTFEFLRTNIIEANVPYLIVPRKAISSVVFYGVKLETPEAISLTTDGRVSFVSSLWAQTIHGPNDFYVVTGSSLRYARTSGTDINGNRAFFRKIGDAASAPRRAIIVIDGEEREVEITDDAIEEVQNVRKYMENGVLIIERNGVRFNAQGQRAE